MIWVLAATLICGACVFTSCKKDKVNTDLNLEENIIGKWEIADKNGQPAPTNEKMVLAFLSPTKGYVSASLSIHSDADIWSSRLETDVAISGNKVTVTFHPDEHNTSVHELNITSINDKEFTANQKVTVTIDGEVVISEEKAFRFVKQTADHSAAILGLWECQELTGIETYNDAKVLTTTGARTTLASGRPLPTASSRTTLLTVRCWPPDGRTPARTSFANGGRLPPSPTAKCSGPPCARTLMAPPPSRG